MSVGTKKIKEEITIEGAEMHNLKNISLKIPKKKINSYYRSFRFR